MSAIFDALLVDVDGVLVRGRPEDGRPWASELARDIGVDPVLLQKHFFAAHWGEVIIGNVGLKQALAPALAELAPQLSCDDLLSYWFAQDARLDSDLLKDIGAWRAAGKMIALATNQEHLRARHLLDTLGLRDHVDRTFYSAAMGAKKPDPAFFAMIESDIGFPASRLLLVDDTEANVAAAERAGWLAIHWTGTRNLGAEIALLAARKRST